MVTGVQPRPSRELNRNEYWCGRCFAIHKKTSKKGRQHVLEAIDGCNATVDRKDTSPEQCSLCHDSGFFDLDPAGIHRRFCSCGQETREERIGIVPRRGHLTGTGDSTDDDITERETVLSRGRTAQCARDAARGNLGEDTGQPVGPGKPVAPEGDGEDYENILPTNGGGVPDVAD